jgi:hypothetical protein
VYVLLVLEEVVLELFGVFEFFWERTFPVVALGLEGLETGRRVELMRLTHTGSPSGGGVSKKRRFFWLGGVAEGTFWRLEAVVDETLDHFGGLRLAGEGELVGVGVGTEGGGDELGGLFVDVLEVGGGVVAWFGLVDDAGAGDVALRVAVGEEDWLPGVTILVEAGIVGVNAVLLRVVEGHRRALRGRTTALELVVHYTNK